MTQRKHARSARGPDVCHVTSGAGGSARTLLLTLARGGSKRLPGKNLLEVGGVSLVGRAVRTARRAARRLGNPARIVVSTDDDGIAREARAWGAETPFLRPVELATDNATTPAAMRHAIDWLKTRGDTFTEVILIQPTSPLCNVEDVIRTVTAHRREPHLSAVTVRPAPHAGRGLLFAIREDKVVEPDTTGTGASLVELNGAVYVCSPSWLLEHDRLCVPGHTVAAVMPPERSVDVDTAVDLETARGLWEQSLLWRPGRCLVVAEAGVNHGGSVETARCLIDAAREAGADAVKFQTFSAERLAAAHAPKAPYQRRTAPADESQCDMLKGLELSEPDHQALMQHCRECGIEFLSSAFGEDDVDLLDRLDVAAIKLGSGEVTNHPLLTHAGETLRPIILSTGCSSLSEVAQSVGVLRRAGCADLALLHCVSTYPAEPADVNLRAMDTLARAFHLPVGYSDHTLGIEVACAAVAIGARIIEKHLTLDRETPGPDHRASIEPSELKTLVSAIRNVETALGDGVKRPAASETDTRVVVRRSLVAATNLAAGTVLRREHLTSKRPGTGISPSQMQAVLGRQLHGSLAADELLQWAHLGELGSPE